MSRYQPQGTESRLTAKRTQDLQQIFRIPGGAFAASLDGSFIVGLADQVECEVPDDGHSLGTVTGS